MERAIGTRLLLTCAIGSLGACGGGGGGAGGSGSGIGSTPPPPPAGSNAVNIFPSPATQEFIVLGTGGDLKIRYDAARGIYEVMAGPLPWTALVDDPLSEPLPGQPNQMFAFAGSGPNESFFIIRAHHSFTNPDVKYSYSNIAQWAVTDPGVFGIGGLSAFGIATPAGGVPVTGSASYNGFLEGFSTVEYQYDSFFVPATVGGSVSLDFDFGSGTLAGLIDPYLDTFQRYDLPSLAFSNTVFGVGSTNFSGSFATVLSGPNSFSGQFTGPNAQELIGKWAFPFLSPIDGALESAAGVWIAKKP